MPAPIQAAEPPVAEPPAQTFEPPAPPAAEPPAAVPPVAERLPSPSPLLNFVSETQSPAERELPNLASTEQILKIQSSASVLESELSNSATADASQSPTTGNRQSQSADSSSSSNEASTSLEESSGANNILKTVFKTELLRIQEFEQYLGVTTDSAESDIPKFQGNLGAIKQQTGRAYALIYVVANPDQLELIVVPPKGSPIHRTVPEAPRETLLAVAKQFRQNITDRRLQHTLQYLQPARQLYQWIISPVEKDLQDMQVDTLLFSLDAGLRTMPIAALYDGQQFLVEKYSFSLTPSFTLTDWDYQSLQNEPILAFGASEFSDQTPLPAVPVELQQVVSSRAPQSVYSPSQDSKSFLNREFTLNNLKNQRATTPFRIVHLATHADFLPGAPSNSYIQLWDRRLRLDELPQLNWNNPQVDLLVLSACRTALGDEQSEMGFAGLAVISGAKSAVASLWYVSDLGTLGLMSEFYQNLREAPIKAEALRLAQIAMIRGTLRVKNGQLIGSNGIIKLPPELAERGDIPLSHPYYWSAFTTIGSPW